MTVTREKLRAIVDRASNDKILRFKEGQTMIRFIPFNRDPIFEFGLFELWSGHFTPQGFFPCLRIWDENCPICEFLLKSFSKNLSAEKKQRLYECRAKPVYLTYVSPNESSDGTGKWLPPKIFIASRGAADTIHRKFLNVGDGEFYEPDGNPSYAIIVDKRSGGKIVPLSFELSRKTYKIPEFQVKPLKEELYRPEFLKTLLISLEGLVMEEYELEDEMSASEVDKEVNEALKSWDV